MYISINYLFQATFEGWMEVMQDAVDSTEVCIKIYARHRENDRSSYKANECGRFRAGTDNCGRLRNNQDY